MEGDRWLLAPPIWRTSGPDSRGFRRAAPDFRRAAATGARKSANGREMRFLFGAIGAIFLTLCHPAAAGMVYAQGFELCGPGDETPPAPTDACTATTIEAIDPQGRDVWIRAHVNVLAAAIADAPPGLFIAAKASSEVYLNGVRLGANGTPAPARSLEKPGRMDAVFPIPDGAVRAGRNDIAIRFSSHRGYLSLRRPVHWVAIAPLVDPVAERLTQMWPSLVALGVILAGAIYFAVIAATGANRRDPALLSLLAFFAASQLIVEISRSLVAYAYPVHDLRLIAIAATSAGFGLTLAALVISRFVAAHKLRAFAILSLPMAFTIAFADGYDAKAGFAVLVATIVSAAIAAHAAMRGEKQGFLYAAALSAFAVSILLFRGFFLDAVFFFEVATLLLVLFAARAVAQERERRESALERARSHELEAALDRVCGRETPRVIRLNAAGAVNVVHASDITHCKGAGDYVELHLADGRLILHNGALTQFEAELPPAFLRVHRSFIVNTDFVKMLKRESTGVGALLLSNGAEVPVSRRIMPKVRSALV
jgi:DNA-binding LytR/AlgR family response regulator